MTTPDRVTVGALLDALGPGSLTPLALPQGRDVIVGSPVIYDPEDTSVVLDGATLLVTGYVNELVLQQASLTGASTIVAKIGDSDSAGLISAAHASGISLLGADPTLAWGTLYTLVSTLHAVYDPCDSQFDDLFSLADQLAADVGGAVAIEDLSMRVLAYSAVEGQRIDDQRMEGILRRRVPRYTADAKEYLTIMRSETALWSYEPSEHLPRLAIAVRANGQALGSIWVIQGDRPLKPDAAEIIAEAARTVGPHLARINLAADEVRRRRDESLSWLLRGLDSAGDVAASYGLQRRESLTVIAVGPVDLSADALATQHIADLLRTALTSYRLRCVAGVADGRVYAIVAMDSGSPLVSKLIADTLSNVSDLRGSVWRAGFSRTVGALAQVPVGTKQADEALRALHGPYVADKMVVRHEQLATAMFLQSADAWVRANPDLLGEPLSLLVQNDELQGTQYRRSLLAWIANHYDVPKAAEVLFLHPNTLRHRLRRIGELIDLDDPDTRLVLALQLRLFSGDKQPDETAIRRHFDVDDSGFGSKRINNEDADGEA